MASFASVQFCNATTSDISSETWMAQPCYRGTLGIVITCVSTLLICVWHAVHLNISVRYSGWRSLKIKMGWMITGIVAPELLLCIALMEFSSAVVFRDKANKILSERPSDVERPELDRSLKRERTTQVGLQCSLYFHS